MVWRKREDLADAGEAQIGNVDAIAYEEAWRRVVEAVGMAVWDLDPVLSGACHFVRPGASALSGLAHWGFCSVLCVHAYFQYRHRAAPRRMADKQKAPDPRAAAYCTRAILPPLAKQRHAGFSKLALRAFGINPPRRRQTAQPCRAVLQAMDLSAPDCLPYASCMDLKS